jgi:RNA polymerase sigma factor (sigma-70 family)
MTRHYFTDEEGDVFWINEEGQGVFACDVREAPTRRQAATPAQVLKYEAANAAYWATVQRYMPECVAALKRVRSDDESLISDVGFPTLRKCLKRFDPGQGEWLAYLRNALWREYRKALQAQRNKQLPDLSHGDEPTVMNDDIPEHDLHEQVRYIVSQLDEHDRALFTLYYWKELSYEEIAMVLGSCKATVCNYMKKALAKARRVGYGLP